MPEQNNDRLEQFFRKAASRSDVDFNEEDWKKLEARLDAADAGKTGAKKTGTKITAAVVVGVVILFSGVVWINSPDNAASSISNEVPARVNGEKPEEDAREDIHNLQANVDGTTDRSTTELTPPSPQSAGVDGKSIRPHSEIRTPATAENERAPARKNLNISGESANTELIDSERTRPEVVSSEENLQNRIDEKILTGGNNEEQIPLVASDETDRDDLTRTPPDVAERNKQKAVVMLPGAEEEDIREAEAMVQEEHASDNKKHVATPRLSLLLSFAPDFSGTSIGQYSAPGKAYGAMLHYHLLNRWSVSVGAIKNHKEYTSPGEDYKPPKGYWKYYTNGVIPETIDGSCAIMEFPVMIQYTAINSGKNKLNIGGGLSSYLMQTESYRYYFDQPNPGAKEGWNSRHSSQFFFNMINLTVGFERQVLPGLMVGIEPYAKIPVEEIGWSNIRLFSSGASVTVRYTILRKGTLSVPTRSRGPD